jgi:dipeptidyl aminopeptidase/acylaminoacyl peptidase
MMKIISHKKTAILTFTLLLFYLVTIGISEAAFPGSNGKIAFLKVLDGNKEIYVMNADGSNQYRLTDNEAYDAQPSWSPDGNKIVFWSDRDGRGDLYTINADGTNLINITNTPEINEYHPDWSPDGTKIAFASSATAGKGDIYVMNIDGTDPTRLTDDDQQAYCPVWSPDGTKIAFCRMPDNYHIYLMNSDGTNESELPTSSLRSAMHPSWSPDGTKIAFEGLTLDYNSEIMAINVDGSNIQNLTNHAAVDSLPAWSPDGTKIAFSTKRSGNYDIYLMNTDGTSPTSLTNDAADEWDTSWQVIKDIDCFGFEPPMDKTISVKKKNRVLPLKMVCYDGETELTDLDIAPPVVEVDYVDSSGVPGAVEEVLYAGQGDEGNQFVYSDGYWRFNLQTKNFSAYGTYTIKAKSGDTNSYTIQVPCPESTFVIK